MSAPKRARRLCCAWFVAVRARVLARIDMEPKYILVGKKADLWRVGKRHAHTHDAHPSTHAWSYLVLEYTEEATNKKPLSQKVTQNEKG